MALKDMEIRALQPRDRIYKKADERGLYIEVHPSGSKLWRFKYGYLGKDKRLALGRYPEVTLAEARHRRDGRAPACQTRGILGLTAQTPPTRYPSHNPAERPSARERPQVLVSTLEKWWCRLQDSNL